jgi:hypothetical protein
VVLRVLGSEEERHGATKEGASEGPSVEEIVIALRDMTGRRGSRDVTPLREVGGRFDPVARERETALPVAAQGSPADDSIAVEFKHVAVPEAGDLREGEIERLLKENRRLNEQVFYLLKLLDEEKKLREQQVAARVAAETAAERQAVTREVRSAFEAELRPLLKAILHQLERPAARHPAVERARPEALIFESRDEPRGEEPPLPERGAARFLRAAQEERARAAAARTASSTETPRPETPGTERSAEGSPPTRSDRLSSAERDRHAGWILDLIEAASVKMPRHEEEGGHDRASRHRDAPDQGEAQGLEDGAGDRDPGLVGRVFHRFRQFRRDGE